MVSNFYIGLMFWNLLMIPNAFPMVDHSFLLPSLWSIFSNPLPFCFLWELSHFSYWLLWALCKLQQFMDTFLAHNGLGKTPLDFSSDVKKRKELPAFSSWVQSRRFLPSLLQQYLSCIYYVSENVALGFGVTSRKRSCSEGALSQRGRRYENEQVERRAFTPMRSTCVGRLWYAQKAGTPLS